MPVYIQCSNCNRKLRVRTELIGRTVRCPGCRARFTAAAAESQAPPSGGSATTAEAEGPESVLPSSSAQEPDESSGPTVRRPISPAVGGPASPAPSARQAITARPAQAAGEPRAAPAEGPAAAAAAAGRVGFETPWSRVGLVLGLILLGVVVLALVVGLWVNAGIRESQRRRTDAERLPPARAAADIPRAAPRSQPGAAGTGRFRPRPSAPSPPSSRSSA